MWWLTDISIFPYIWLQLLRGHHSIEVLLNHIMIECLTTNTGESLMSINAQYICHSECSMLRTHNMSHHIAYLSIPITGGATSFPIYWTHLSPPCNIWKWHLICWLYYSMKYSCRIVVGTHSAHSVTLLNCEKLECRVCGHLLFGMGSMQSLIPRGDCIEVVGRPNSILDWIFVCTTECKRLWNANVGITKTSTRSNRRYDEARKTLINWFFILCCMFPVI